MTAILWILIIIAFALAFIGLIKPVIPSLLMLWIGFLIYQFGFHEGRLSWIFYVAMIIFTIMILVADFVMNKYLHSAHRCDCRLFRFSSLWYYHYSFCCCVHC